MPFRKLVRAAAGVALLVPFATCTDFTGPSGGRGVRVAVAPTFSKEATFAKAVYAAAGIEYDRVRVLITRNQSEILKDTTVAFSPTSAELPVPLVITANPGEVVDVTLEYRLVDLILYSGTQSVVTVPMGAPAAEPTALVVVPKGPGFDAALVQISPAAGSFPTAAAVPFTATALKADNSIIPNAVFGWEIDDATVASITSQGVVQPTSKGGPVKVRATTVNGKFAEALVTFVTAPAALVIQSGGAQSAQAFDALPSPVVVKVLDANAAAVPGATVTFAVATGGGSIAVVNGVSNASGLATVNWTLGATVGAQSITATVSGVPALTINATATERPAKTLAFSQQPSPVGMNAPIAPAVTVRALDDKGNVVLGYTGAITVAFDANPTGATLGGTLTVNAVAGVASFSTLTVNKHGEGYKLKAAASGLTGATSAAFAVSQVATALTLAGGGGQIAAVSSTLSQISAKVSDANGVGVPGITVTFAVTTGGGSVVVDNAVTDADGLARATWKLGAALGTQTLTATVTGLTGSPLSIPATATPLPATTLAFVQQPSTVAMNAVMSPAVTVRAVDADGNTVTGFTGNITLTLGTNPTAATLGGTLTKAAVAGVATFSDLSVNKQGSGYKLSAGSGTLPTAASNAFTVDPVAATLSLSAGSGQTATILSPLSQIVAKVADANGDGVAGITVSFAVTSGGGSIVVNNGVTDASGLARATWTLGSTIGTQSITITSGSLSGSPLTVEATGTPLPAVALAFVQQPPASAVRNANFAPAVTVRAIDVNGNTVTGFAGNISLTLGVNPTSATLGGTLTMTAVAGVATFSNLAINLTGTGYKLSATSGALNASSDAFNVVSPPAAALQFVVQPTNVVTGVAFSPVVTVKVVDALGILIDDGPSITIEMGFDGFIDAGMGGTTSANTAGGIAAFPDLYVYGYTGSAKLRATSEPLTAAVSNSFLVSLPPPVSKVWTGAVSTNWNDAGNWNPAGAPVAQDSVTIVSAANQPFVTVPIYADAIVVENGATLQILQNSAIIMTDKVVNKGTLTITAGTFLGSMENYNLVITDSMAFVESFKNVGASSKLVVRASRGTAPAIFDANTALTNEGEIRLEDTNNAPAYLYVIDSLLNTATGTINVTQGAGSANRSISATLINKGALNATATGGLYLSDPGQNRTSVNDGTMTFTGNTPFYHYFTDSTLLFKNNGVITMGTGVWEVLEGTYDLKTGTVNGTGQFSSFYSKLGIDFSKFFLTMKLNSGTRFVGDSMYVATGTTAKLIESTLDTNQRVIVRGTLQVLNSSAGGSLFRGPVSVFTGGIFDIRDNADVDSTFTLSTGGKLSLNATGQNINADFAKAFTNSGTIELTSSGVFESMLTVAGTLTNPSGSSISALNGSGGGRVLAATLSNAGAITVGTSTYLTVRRGSATHTNTGTIDLTSTGTAGTADFNNKSFTIQGLGSGSTFNNAGTISIGSNRSVYVDFLPANALNNQAAGVIRGTGKLRVATANGSTFSNAGTIAPGTAGTVGTLTFEGNFTTSGTLNIDLFGSVASGNYDRLVVVGTLTAGGGTVLLNQSVGAVQDTWPIASASAVSGSLFPTINLGFPWGGTSFDLTFKTLLVSNIVIGAPPP